MRLAFLLGMLTMIMHASTQAQDCPLSIGKRLPMRREINAANLTNPGSSGRRTFYQFPGQEWRPVGFYGHRLKPYLVQDSLAHVEFIKFRWNKFAHHASYTTSLAGVFLYHVVAFRQLWLSRNPAQAYFGWKSLPFLAGSLVAALVANAFDLNASRHLGMSMFYYNRHVCGSFSLPK